MLELVAKWAGLLYLIIFGACVVVVLVTLLVNLVKLTLEMVFHD